MKRVRITAVVLSMMILFSMVMANKTKTVYADEVEETTETSVESEEETVSTEETSTEETSVEEAPVEEAQVEEAQVEEVYLLLDVNKEFVSKIFKTNQDFYYDLNADQANHICTREDVDKSIKMLPQLDAVSILYQTRSANDGGKSLNVRYSLPEELMTYMSNPEQMKALGIYVNGVQIPLDSYSFNNDGSEYYFYANDDAGCCFDFSSGTLDLWFDEAFTAAEQERTDLGVPINSEIFPDDFFRSYVFDHFDVNKDMYLSDNEIRPVEIIDVSDRFITDLKGIEQFTNLRSLYCFNNSLSSLDISGNTKLFLLFCDNNNLTSLDFSNNKELQYLYCDGNQLTGIDLSPVPNLLKLSCAKNRLTSLDVSNNSKLIHISCWNNQLTYLDLSDHADLETVYCEDNSLTGLKLNNCPEINTLNCLNNSLSALYIGSCDKLSSADMNIDRGVVLISDIAPDICVDTHITYEPEVETPVEETPAVESPVVETPEEVATVDMYRLYNPNSGEHFFTASAGERDSLVAAGWSNEGIGWKAPVSSNTPVYRLYNQNGGEHHYTTSASEKNNLVAMGWTDEGIGWYSDDNHGVPVYRQYNPNSFSNNHNYSTSASENDWLVSIGWQSEGIAWYGVD